VLIAFAMASAPRTIPSGFSDTIPLLSPGAQCAANQC
jgi:hypothetical protein